MTNHDRSKSIGDSRIHGPLPDLVWDAVVVGAGPGGAMTAHELSRLGKAVLLLDSHPFPRWKVCGATLSPGALHSLSEAALGGILERSGAGSLRILRLGGWSVRADLPLNGSLALSRSALDSSLAEAAVDRGAYFRTGARARLGSLEKDRRILEVSIGGEKLDVSARAIIAADGLGSGIMAQAGVPARVPSAARRRVVGLGGVFPPSTPHFEPGVIHMAVGDEGYVGLVRVEDGSLNVAAALNPAALRQSDSPGALVNSLLRSGGWPELLGLPEPGWRGTPELTRRPERPGAERIFAVGDAAGYVEPFTGEGVFWALSGARMVAPLAARAARLWDGRILDDWSRAHARLMGKAQLLCRATSFVLARPLLTRPLLRVLMSYPHLSGPVVRRIGAPIVSFN